MAPSHVAVALGAALFALLVIFQLGSTLGFPEIDYWHWKQSYAEEYGEQIGQNHEFMEKDTAVPAAAATIGTQYLLGVGKADITGPVVELNLMGYANTSQIGTGLRQRLYSRAFIIGDPDDGSQRFVYMILDTQSGDTAVRYGILQGLAALGPDYAMYGQSNVAVVGTHSHSGPGAWLNYLLPQITSLGFDQESYQAIVNGAILSVQRAHESLATGTLSVGTTNIEDANINRSLWAYLANPEEERAQYTDSVDKTMTLLRFTRASDGKDIGLLNWFAVHGTSMLGNNTIVTADNKGVAAYLFEQDMLNNSNAAEGFVAGFSQANVGDTSPNVLGAWCEDGSGEECTLQDSTCGGKNEPCHGRGPFFGLNDGGTKSCFEIGRRQYSGARNLWDSMNDSATPITGSAVRSLHTFVDFSNFTFTLPNGTVVSTCAAALGDSFAAGTTDGPGAFNFKQGTSEPNSNPFWNAVGSLVHIPSPEQVACQAPKPILLDVGNSHIPYDWAPNIVDIQLLRVGQFIIIVSPGEATTMSGRRWRNAISSAASASALVDPTANSTDPIVVLGAPANSYTHYIATPEEYMVQRYEGASTLYGRHTLDAYINLTLTYLPYLADAVPSSPLPAGPSPPDNANRSLSFISPVVYDGHPLGKPFGAVLTDVSPSYPRGANVTATFQAANPRNNLRLEGTYAAVEQQQSSGAWAQVRSDADWEVLFQWARTNEVLAYSQVSVAWNTSADTPPGTYRLRYYGDAKALVGGGITGFSGASASFVLT